MDALKTKFEAAGQAQVFQFVDKLSAEELATLKTELEAIDLDQVNANFKRTQDEAATPASSSPIEPLKNVTKQSDASADEVKGWNDAGLAAVADGKVALLLLAGGQGTRLGSSNPKGQYDIGLPSKKSLFQLQAERLRRVQSLAAAQAGGAACVVPWYIMTSPATDAPTRAYFAEQKYFGLAEENVFFFQQAMLPCLTPDGKIMLETTSTVAKAPNGNGGLYPALRDSGALADMAKRGVEHVHAYCVDNALVKVADPVFVGYCIAKGAECGSKVVAKAEPGEKIGIFALRDGKNVVVEYSEIDDATAELRADNGDLVFNAGNIANHYYTLDFLQRTASDFANRMQFHVAHKKIKTTNAEGVSAKPDTNNGIKLELFIFDVFEFATNKAYLVVGRETDFAPVKNAPGSNKDSPDTARALISDLHKQFVTAAGGKLVGDGLCEVSPLLSYAGEGLEKAASGVEFTLPTEISA